MVAPGTLVGIPAAIVAAHIARDQIPGLPCGPAATDPPSNIWSAAIFLVVAAISAYLPARRASHVEPMATLRIRPMLGWLVLFGGTAYRDVRNRLSMSSKSWGILGCSDDRHCLHARPAPNRMGVVLKTASLTKLERHLAGQLKS